MIFFSSPNIEAHYHAGTSEFALVTFSPMNWIGKGNDFWGLSIAQKAGINAIGFVAKSDNWFPEKDMADAIRAARPLLARFKHVITYGTSMGAYGALKYSSDLSATCVLSFCPQFSIAPSDVGSFDNRFTMNFASDLHSNMAIAEQDVCRDAFVFYDPGFTSDVKNVDLIENHAPRITRVKVPNSGHATIELMAGTQIVTRLFQLAVKDRASIHRYIDGVRRSSPLRRRHLIEKMSSRRSIEASLAAFNKYRPDFTDRQAALFCVALSKEYLKRKDSRSALQQANTAFNLAPTEVGTMLYMSRLQESLGHIEEAVAWANKTLANNPRAPHFFLQIGNLFVRSAAPQLAEQALLQGLRLNPNNNELTALLKSISRAPA